MTLDECIATLTAIRDEHGGDLLVLHHDDWDDFLVESVTLQPAQDGKDPLLDCVQPKHVVLSGDRRRFNCEDGTVV